MIEVLDDIIYTESLILLHDFFMNEETYGYGNKVQHNIGEIPTHVLFGKLYMNNDPRTNFEVGDTTPRIVTELFHVASKPFGIDSEQVYQISVNFQTKFQDGSFHYDDGDTLMVFPLAIWKKEWGGQFEYKDGDEIKQIDYVPGRILYFKHKDKIHHRGLGPVADYIGRVSLIFRILS